MKNLRLILSLTISIWFIISCEENNPTEEPEIEQDESLSSCVLTNWNSGQNSYQLSYDDQNQLSQINYTLFGNTGSVNVEFNEEGLVSRMEGQDNSFELISMTQDTLVYITTKSNTQTEEFKFALDEKGRIFEGYLDGYLRRRWTYNDLDQVTMRLDGETDDYWSEFSNYDNKKNPLNLQIEFSYSPDQGTYEWLPSPINSKNNYQSNSSWVSSLRNYEFEYNEFDYPIKRTTVETGFEVSYSYNCQ